MKNISLILNIVLSLAVIGLYYMQFSTTDPKAEESVVDGQGSGEFVIAYIQSDSLAANYQFVVDENEKIRKRSSQLEDDNRARLEGLQKEVADYQTNYGNLTIGQARTIEENLAQKEQNLRVFQERSRQELVEMQTATNLELYKRVTDFLKKYSEENGIQMVVKFDPSSDVLYAGEGLNITKEVISTLNAEYSNPVSSPADSTAVK